ncbi:MULTISPECIES: hypothetical protein [Gordonia]|uniref:hypothetical protein n=1 Tax=Gordonia TaxID=2053 RepID=UPI00244838C9|nr:MULTISPECIES: hypothetical protein [Gordonia]MDH3015647.1 hypothetical protein [Gordonia alkanivorans]MDH3020381.1 hypothetical protein [Gordonia alkanivorans]MDH3026663.1 hypothetical protein [Gordonia alkanivorans]MDH3040205.1 hypothetical protein [Gordonia alkanivorans]MDH3044624.1 hypothetical protein [Gordonia alkanivorans]
MRPRPSEIIAGIRTVLKDTVAPSCSGEHARARLDEIRAVLAQVDWDNAGFELAQRTDRLEVALREARRWLDDELPPKPEQREYAAIEQHYERLAALAAAALTTLREARDRGPEADAATEAYQGLLRSL